MIKIPWAQNLIYMCILVNWVWNLNFRDCILSSFSLKGNVQWISYHIVFIEIPLYNLMSLCIYYRIRYQCSLYNPNLWFSCLLLLFSFHGNSKSTKLTYLIHDIVPLIFIASHLYKKNMFIDKDELIYIMMMKTLISQ